jgi:hypothetical protein
MIVTCQFIFGDSHGPVPGCVGRIVCGIVSKVLRLVVQGLVVNHGLLLAVALEEATPGEVVRNIELVGLPEKTMSKFESTELPN